MDEKDIKCSKCGGDTILGDVRSGVLSFGSQFVELIKSASGKLKPKPGISNQKVISFACTKCGYIEHYLQG